MVFNYVSQEYQNAPPIKMLEIKDIAKLLTMKDTKYTTVDFIIYYYSHHLKSNEKLNYCFIKFKLKIWCNEQQYFMMQCF